MSNKKSGQKPVPDRALQLISNILHGSGSAIIGWGSGAAVFALTLLRTVTRLDLFESFASSDYGYGVSSDPMLGTWVVVLALCAIAGTGVGLVCWQLTERLDAWRFAAGD